jgi:hypothetical protein
MLVSPPWCCFTYFPGEPNNLACQDDFARQDSVLADPSLEHSVLCMVCMDPMTTSKPQSFALSQMNNCGLGFQEAGVQQLRWQYATRARLEQLGKHV